jgi:broad specificity phosphatase PhoE
MAFMAEKTSTSQLVLCQSGRTQWDVEERLQGATDMPLSDVGRAEMESALSAFAPIEIGVIYAPPDEGAQATARLVAACCGGKVKSAPKLKGVGLGLWEGSLITEVRERFAKAYRLWREDPAAITPMEGESIGEAEARLIPAIERILEKATKGTPVVVLRPVMLGLLKCRLTDRPTSELWKLLDEQPPVELVTVDRSTLSRKIEKVKAS